MVRAAAAAFLLMAIAACGAPALSFSDEAKGGAGSQSSSGSSGSGGAGGSNAGGSGAPGDASNEVDASIPIDASGDASEIDVANTDASASDGAAPCSNGVLDPGESDVDCGGTSACARCPIAGVCHQDSDCNSAYCKQGYCAQGSCFDNVKNLKETDVDCGGGDCPPCGIGARCVSYTDCAQQSCIAGKCQSVSCNDGFLGPGETDVDCGGTVCAPCVAGKQCAVARDCASGVCEPSHICDAPTCSDGVQNGNETGRDCGGGCGPCPDGQGCMIGADCSSGVCSGRACQKASCSDTVKNGGETDVDCGGSCPKCPAGRICSKDADCARGNCAGTCQLCPRDMANVPTIGGSSYCVDATEVTVSAYSAFLTTNPPISLFPSVCSARTSFTPSQSLDLAHPNNPVSSVDWCQAYGYCAGIGRHLCGRIGGGASLSGSEGTDPMKSEWFNACSKGGTRSYPYGNNFMFVCSTNQIAAVQSASGCVGGYPGIYDMSGNVAEWEDDCQGSSGANDNCATRGGSVTDNMLSCSGTANKKRSSASQSIGFRCCL